MTDHKDVRVLSPDQLESVSGGAETLGVYRPGFQFTDVSFADVLQVENTLITPAKRNKPQSMPILAEWCF